MEPELHRAYVSQLKGYVETVRRAQGEDALSQENAGEFERQFQELKAAILKIEEYREVFPLLEVQAGLPDPKRNVWSILTKLRPSRAYEEALRLHFSEVAERLTRVLSHLRQQNPDPSP